MKLTEKVRQLVVTDILNGKYAPGEKIPAEREMSELASASRVTVRRAYDDLEKNGIITRTHGSGTRVVDHFTGNTDPIEYIALLITLQDPFARNFIEAVQKSCNENDILMILAITEEDVREQEQMAVKIVGRGVKNMIVWGFDNSLDIGIFERMRILGVNLVFFDRVVPGPAADFISLDNKHALAEIFAEARRCGCDNFVYADTFGLDVDSNRQRKDAFRNECQQINQTGAEFQVPWQWDSEDEVTAVCEKFFTDYPHKKNIALVCVNDVIAKVLCQVVSEYVKVFSIDGSPDALQMGITTYSQPIDSMAEESVNALIRQASKGDKWHSKDYLHKGVLLFP